MPGDTRESGRPELSAAALQEWNGHVENVMRGVAHALNNRAAALSAVMELSRDPEEGSDVIGSILTSELERVNELVSVVRLVGVPKQNSEAFVPSDVATEAMRVLRIHAELRDRAITIDGSGAPLRVARWMFLRALIGFAAAAPRSAEARISLEDQGDWLEVRLDSTSPEVAVTPLVAELARAMQGEPLAGSYAFRVPTLVAIRKREGREG